MYHTEYDVLCPFVTDRVLELVRCRLLEGSRFFEHHALKPEFSKSETKLALLLVRVANPKEYLNSDEINLLEGCTRQQQSSSLEPQSSSPKPHRPSPNRKPKKRG